MGSSAMQQSIALVAVALALTATLPAFAYDPTITTDFGLTGAKLTGENFTSRDFEAKNLPPATGFVLVPNQVAQFPGVTGLGVSTLYFILGSGALVPPHIHQRATEIFFVISGTWLVGFIDTTNKLFTTTLYPGDQFIFPIGLIHYQLVTSAGTATGISSFNSQNPGLSLIPTSLFGSTPPVPDSVLAPAFAITPAQVDAIKKQFQP